MTAAASDEQREGLVEGLDESPHPPGGEGPVDGAVVGGEDDLRDRPDHDLAVLHDGRGATCADGGPCDADGTIDGRCSFLVAFCLNVQSEALPACGPSEVSSLSVTGGKLKGGGTLDLS